MIARLFANENIPRSVVRYLRDRGHDVLTVPDAGLQGAPDLAIVERAAAEHATGLFVVGPRGYRHRDRAR